MLGILFKEQKCEKFEAIETKGAARKETVENVLSVIPRRELNP